jgi:hypothetical protein
MSIWSSGDVEGPRSTVFSNLHRRINRIKVLQWIQRLYVFARSEINWLVFPVGFVSSVVRGIVEYVSIHYTPVIISQGSSSCTSSHAEHMRRMRDQFPLKTESSRLTVGSVNLYGQSPRFASLTVPKPSVHSGRCLMGGYQEPTVSSSRELIAQQRVHASSSYTA